MKHLHDAAKGRPVKPAAFRRLCVETAVVESAHKHIGPAAFRRLCVETLPLPRLGLTALTSRLQAAVC